MPVIRVGAFIENHDDICAEIFLNGNGLLRREAMRGTVNVTLEGHAVVVNFARLRKREDLKAARIGQHGIVPLHKVMQSAHIAHEFITGAQIKMIGVAQHQRGIDTFELFRCKHFDRSLRAHRREDGRL